MHLLAGLLYLAGSQSISLPQVRCAHPKMCVVAPSTTSTSTTLVWNEAPDNTWRWKTGSNVYTVNYVVAGDASKEPILLIHGFGASSFHWRRNVNVLAEAGYRVYAIDLRKSHLLNQRTAPPHPSFRTCSLPVMSLTHAGARLRQLDLV